MLSKLLWYTFVLAVFAACMIYLTSAVQQAWDASTCEGMGYSYTLVDNRDVYCVVEDGSLMLPEWLEQ